jgi:hypothetical protein
MKNSIDLMDKSPEIMKNPEVPDTSHFDRGVLGFPLLAANSEMIT